MRAEELLKTRCLRCGQFGLRGLFLIIAACAAALAAHTTNARKQNEAVKAIMQWGGEVVYDFEDESEGKRCMKTRAWLRRCLGDDVVSNVTHVRLEPCSDAQLEELAKLTGLRHFVSRDAHRLSDAGVARLAELAGLRSIYLAGSDLTDESFRVFGKLPQLERLHVARLRLSDAALSHLRNSARLRSLLLEDDLLLRRDGHRSGGNSGGVTDTGMRALAGLVNLEELDLRGSRITSNGAVELSGLTKLRVLILSESAYIADDALQHLAHLPNLEELRLNDTRVSSAGLQQLSGLTKLRILDLSGNRTVTNDGIAHLSGLVNLEELKLHETGITSCVVIDLQGMSKLRRLDISDNREVDDNVLGLLAKLPALESLDLHNTRVRLYGRLARRNRDRLRQLPRLRQLDLSGTGADVDWLEAFFPPRRTIIIGSRTAFTTRPRLLGTANYHDVILDIDLRRGPLVKPAASAIGHTRMLAHLLSHAELDALEVPARDQRLAEHYLGWPLREALLECTLSRMLALCDLPGLGMAFREERRPVEDFIESLHSVSYTNETAHAAVFRNFLVAAKLNERLRRLYAAATALHLADALSAHLRCLDGIKRNWLLTDRERKEYEQAPRYLEFCLQDVSKQLGLEDEGTSATELSDEILAIWQQTRPQWSDRPYLSCWE
jgi:Leucine-rich repeat (LRR) protein